MHAQGKKGVADPLKGLRNIGSAARADLVVLGITKPKSRAKKSTTKSRPRDIHPLRRGDGA
jgi:hypothetical protein